MLDLLVAQAGEELLVTEGVYLADRARFVNALGVLDVNDILGDTPAVGANDFHTFSVASLPEVCNAS